MDEKYLKNFMLPVTILLLLFMSFLIVKPLAVSILLGLLFGYIFYPLYLRLNKRISSKNLSATLVVLIIALVILLPIIILTPTFVKQIFQIYSDVKNADISKIVLQFVPTFSSSPAIQAEIIAASSHLNAKLSEFLLSLFQNTILNIPSIAFGVVIAIFTFFFALRDGEHFRDYLSVLFSLPREYEDRFYKRFDQVTNSLIYGHFVVGVAQGLISGLGYFIFGVPNALLFTILTTIAGILPIIGPGLIWIPLDIFLFISGDTSRAAQLLIYGLFVITWVDTILRPQIVSKRAEMNVALVLIGSIGGVYAFGVMGFILGPLVLAYLILLIEIYKDKKTESIVIKENKEEVKKE